MKNLMHVKHGGIYWILSFILGLSACKDSISEEGNIPYDPSLPVAITGFTPDSRQGRSNESPPQAFWT